MEHPDNTVGWNEDPSSNNMIYWLLFHICIMWEYKSKHKRTFLLDWSCFCFLTNTIWPIEALLTLIWNLQPSMENQVILNRLTKGCCLHITILSVALCSLEGCMVLFSKKHKIMSSKQKHIHKCVMKHLEIAELLDKQLYLFP